MSKRKQSIILLNGKVAAARGKLRHSSNESFRMVRGRIFLYVLINSYLGSSTARQRNARRNFRLAVQYTSLDLQNPLQRAKWQALMDAHNALAHRRTPKIHFNHFHNKHNDPLHFRRYDRLCDFILGQYQHKLSLINSYKSTKSIPEPTIAQNDCAQSAEPIYKPQDILLILTLIFSSPTRAPLPRFPL